MKKNTQQPSLKNLLIIAYYFPPVHVVGTIRLYHFHKEAKTYFQEIQILTSSNTQYMRQDNALETHSPNIHYIPTLDLRRLSLQKKKGQSPHVSSTTKKSPIFLLLQKLADTFPFSLLLADGGPLYLYKAYQAGKKQIQHGNTSHVFSSFRPYADHLIAHLLKRKFPHLFWIADFRDLPIDPIRKNTFWPRLQRSWNRYVLKKADLVTTVSKGLAKHFEPLHPQVYVLPNGIDSSAMPLSSTRLYQDKFTISYTGSFYKNLRSPIPLLQAIRHMLDIGILRQDEINILYAGNDGQYWDQMINDHQLQVVSKNMGLISYSASKEIQQKSHLNLLLSWTSPESSGIMTGKLYDYLAASRPILALINGTKDEEFEARFEEWKAGRIFYNERTNVKDEIVAYLAMSIGIWRETGGLASTLEWEKLKGYRWNELLKGLIEKI